MIAPDTAPQIFPVREIPAPNPHPIFFAVLSSSPSSSENAEKTADEQVIPWLKLANATSDFVMAFLLFSLFYPIIVLNKYQVRGKYVS
jgi:hypothetical protein